MRTGRGRGQGRLSGGRLSQKGRTKQIEGALNAANDGTPARLLGFRQGSLPSPTLLGLGSTYHNNSGICCLLRHVFGDQKLVLSRR